MGLPARKRLNQGTDEASDDVGVPHDGATVLGNLERMEFLLVGAWVLGFEGKVSSAPALSLCDAGLGC